MANATIVEQRPIADPDPSRAGKPAMLVIYRVDTAPNPRTVVVPGDKPTYEQIQQAIRTNEQRVGEHAGRTFTL